MLNRLCIFLLLFHTSFLKQKLIQQLIKELNDSSRIGAYGAMATLSVKVSEMAKDLKQLQRLPAILTDPKVTTDPRKTLEEISKKYSKKHL